MKFTKKELTELCFSLLNDSTKRNKTNQNNFEKGRKKLLNELKKLENVK